MTLNELGSAIEDFCSDATRRRVACFRDARFRLNFAPGFGRLLAGLLFITIGVVACFSALLVNPLLLSLALPLLITGMICLWKTDAGYFARVIEKLKDAVTDIRGGEIVTVQTKSSGSENLKSSSVNILLHVEGNKATQHEADSITRARR